MEELGTGGRSGKITLVNRKDCVLTGVKDVLAFDIHEVLLETEQGMLQVRGDDLHVSHLNLEQGEVDVDGRVDSLIFSENTVSQTKKSSFWDRLFK